MHALTQQGRVTAASLSVSWILIKKRHTQILSGEGIHIGNFGRKKPKNFYDLKKTKEKNITVADTSMMRRITFFGPVF